MIRITVPVGVSVLAIGGFESEIVLPSQTLHLTNIRYRPFRVNQDGECYITGIPTADCVVSRVAPEPMPSADLVSKQTMILAMQPVVLGSMEMSKNGARRFNLDSFGVTSDTFEPDPVWLKQQKDYSDSLGPETGKYYNTWEISETTGRSAPPLPGPLSVWTTVSYHDDEFALFQEALLQSKLTVRDGNHFHAFKTLGETVSYQNMETFRILLHLKLEKGAHLVYEDHYGRYVFHTPRTLILSGLKRRIMMRKLSDGRYAKTETLTADATLSPEDM